MEKKWKKEDLSGLQPPPVKKCRVAYAYGESPSKKHIKDLEFILVHRRLSQERPCRDGFLAPYSQLGGGNHEDPLTLSRCLLPLPGELGSSRGTESCRTGILKNHEDPTWNQGLGMIYSQQLFFF